MKMDSDPLASSQTSTLTQAAILLKSDRVSVFGRYVVRIESNVDVRLLAMNDRLENFRRELLAEIKAAR